MTTQAQILANRQNAQKSTGPRSTHGKSAASQNALKHGLFTRSDVIRSERQADFDLYHRRILEELDPQSPIESMLAERFINLSWRLKRTCRIQNHTIDTFLSPDTPSPLARLSKSLFQNDRSPSESSPHLTLGRMAVKDFSNQRVLERLLMYERRLESSLYKTILEIQRLNLLRNMKPKNPLDSLPQT